MKQVHSQGKDNVIALKESLIMIVLSEIDESLILTASYIAYVSAVYILVLCGRENIKFSFSVITANPVPFIFFEALL